MKRAGPIAAFVFLAVIAASGASVAQDEPRFTAVPIESCLSGAGDREARLRCIGLGASACMETHESGFTTVGMGFCTDAELGFWDSRLNAAYKQLMAKSKASDAEMKELGATVPSLAETLREMQRAWIPFRDAACDYERAQWGNGTGGGPAALACLMDETARQALRLEFQLNHGIQ